MSLYALLNSASQQTEIPSQIDEGLDTRIYEGFRGKVKEDTDSLTNDFFDILLAAFKLYHVVIQVSKENFFHTSCGHPECDLTQFLTVEPYETSTLIQQQSHHYSLIFKSFFSNTSF